MSSDCDSLSVLAEYNLEFSLPTMTKTRGCHWGVSLSLFSFLHVYFMQELKHPDCDPFYEFCWFKQSVLCKTLVLCRLWPLQSQCCKPDKILLGSKATHDNGLLWVMSLCYTSLSHSFVIKYRIMILGILILNLCSYSCSCQWEMGTCVLLTLY